MSEHTKGRLQRCVRIWRRYSGTSFIARIICTPCREREQIITLLRCLRGSGFYFLFRHRLLLLSRMTNTPVFLLLQLWDLSGQVKSFICFVRKESMHLAIAAVLVRLYFLMAWRYMTAYWLRCHFGVLRRRLLVLHELCARCQGMENTQFE